MKDIEKIKQAAFSFFLMATGMLCAPASVILDVVVLKHGVRENGVTETSQELCLLASMSVMYVMAHKLPAQRGFLILVAGMFLTMFLRELDYFFDRISHGFWKYPVLLVLIITFALASFFRRSIIPAMADATRSYPFAYILAGLAVVLFFSRVFGTGSLWSSILEAGAGSSAPALVKNSIQEGLELLGYVLILYGCVMFARLNWQADSKSAG